MEIKKYDRKPFTVDAVQITPQNAAEVAEWCGGEVVSEPTRVLGTTVDLPAVKLKGKGNAKDEVAQIGSWIVMRKGSARMYKNLTFEATFDERIEEQANNDPVIETLTEDELTSKL